MLLRVQKFSFRKILKSSILLFLVAVMTFSSMQLSMVLNISNTVNALKPKTPSVLPAPKVDLTPGLASSVSPASTTTLKKEDKTIERELVDKRTEFTSTFVTKDGSKLLRYSFDQQNYKDGSSWKKVDNTIDSTSRKEPFGNSLLTLQAGSPIGTKSEFSGKAGKLSTLMNSLSKGLQINLGTRTITMTPVGAKNVLPEKFDEYGVIYRDAWPNVDLRYELRGESVKEIIVLKSKAAQTSFNFNVTGGKVINHPTKKDYLTVEGMPEEFSFSQLTLDVNGQGVISWPPLSQSPTPSGIKIALDEKWMKAQPNSSFPMLIDPSFGREASSWAMFKSDGYSCGPSVCYANTGAIYNSGWKNWRTYFNFPYSDLAGKKILDATMHGIYKSGAGGTTDGRGIYLGHANCISYNCLGVSVGSQYVNTDFYIKFTDRLQYNINVGDYGAWWSLRGEEGAYTSFKPYYTVYGDIYYDTPTPVATPHSPVDKQVLVDTQPTLRVNPVSDPDGDAVQYYFRVSTSPDAESGAVVNSQWINTPQWTIPDGILQDGTTYYWHVYSSGVTSTTPNWVSSFKVDLRTGKDSTQAYQNIGPVGVDLATGNMITDISTHSMNALGGDIGLNLSYNTTSKSKNGLIGEYWNVGSGYSFASGAPTSTPNLTQNDSAINFDWAGSPGPNVNADWFYARWKGYFVAPNTGSYNFGATVDDNVAVYLNNQKVYERGCCGGPDYTGSTAVFLQAGQIVPLRVEFLEATGAGYAKLYVKNGAQEQIVPASWLKTDVQASLNPYGLTGNYYTDDGSHTFPTNPTDPNRFMMQRNDSKLTFIWPNGGSPAAGLASDFMTKWTGYVTVPTSGSYTFGANSDDGVRIKTGTGAFGAYQTVLDSWGYTPDDRWASAVNLTAGVPTPITIEFFDGGGPGQFILKVNGGGANGEIPVKWLSPKAQSLPSSWQIGVNISGNVAYERLIAAGNNVTLIDSTRSTHEYTWNSSTQNYKPPVNEDGFLTKNGDNTYTLVDTDGRTYIFGVDGLLKSLTTPVDDRTPTSLKYEYSGDPSKLVKISDGVTANRYGTLHYKSVNEEGNCSTPSGFDTAPDGMLCAFRTSDGSLTKFYYKTGQLSRIEKPGNELNDFGYDSFGRIVSIRSSLASDAIIAGVRPDDANVNTELTYDVLGRVSTVTPPATTPGASRMAYSVEYQTSLIAPLYKYYNGQDHFTSTIQYLPGYSLESIPGYVLTNSVAGTHALYSCKSNWDEFVSNDGNCEGTVRLGLLGYIYDAPQTSVATIALYRCRVNSNGEHFVSVITNCEGQVVEGIQGYIINGYYPQGRSLLHVAGASEPNGFSKKVEYDSLLRTNAITDVAGLKTKTEWDSTKDLVLSSTDVTDTKSTTIYDDDGRPLEKYGPAPASMFGSDRRPLSAYTGTVPKTVNAYDENIQGLDVTWFGASSSTNGFNTSAKAHTTGIKDVDTKWIGRDFRTETIPSNYNLGTDYGFTGTGKIVFPGSGTYTFKVWHDDGYRISIDDKMVINDWSYRSEGIAQNAPSGTFVAEAGKAYRIRIDYIHFGNAGGLEQWIAGPGITDTNAGLGTSKPTFIYPNYGLNTSVTTYDAQVGDTKTTTQYSSAPYGIMSSTTLDPQGLNYQTQVAYEPLGTGFMRQTSKTLPGGANTTYQYYGVSDTVTVGATNYSDNGGYALDPCSGSPTYGQAILQAGRAKSKIEPTGRQSQTVYDHKGNVIATKYNGEPWTCLTFDSRGRSISSITPTYNGKPSTTVSHSYAVAGNPLITSISDESGSLTSEIDLSGRVIKYTDAKGKITETVYDAFGKILTRTSPVGIESFEYDSYDRLTKQKLDNVVFANITYDAYGRAQTISYGNGLSLQPAVRDSLGRVNKVTYTASGQTISDEVVMSQSGLVTSGIQNGVNKSYAYDKSNRLLSATIGSDSFSYTYGTPDASCNGVPGNNTTSYKDSNRSSSTINGVTTTYCYNTGDQLIASSDARLTTPIYDTHGNVTQLGDSTHQTSFGYDISDRNTSITETYAGGDTKDLTYQRDVNNRLLRRILSVNGNQQSDISYSYSNNDDQPTLMLDSAGTIVQKYLYLPGGVMLTIKPQSSSAGALTYSLTNIHKDVMATVNADGTASLIAMTGPFGESLQSRSRPNNAGSTTSFDYLGGFAKSTDVSFAIGPVQMGARVYIPELGRFLQIDPVEGGMVNNYVYSVDPVNGEDNTGKCGPFIILCAVLLAVASAVSIVNAKKAIEDNPKSPAAWVGGGLAVAGLGAGPSIISIATKPRTYSPTPPQASNAVRQIEKTGTTPYNAHEFKNYEEKLPDFDYSKLRKITYMSHDLKPGVKAERGVERIVQGSDGSLWYTDDHYITFVRIK